MNEQTPAYFLRKEDSKPFVGFIKYVRRSALGAIAEEKRTGKYCGPGSDYDMTVKGRVIILGLYNAALVGIPIAVGVAELVKFLSQ